MAIAGFVMGYGSVRLTLILAGLPRRQSDGRGLARRRGASYGRERHGGFENVCFQRPVQRGPERGYLSTHHDI
jgi:hypothetical protein